MILRDNDSYTEKKDLVKLNSNGKWNQNFLVKSTRILVEITRILIDIIVLVKTRILVDFSIILSINIVSIRISVISI